MEPKSLDFNQAAVMRLLQVGHELLLRKRCPSKLNHAPRRRGIQSHYYLWMILGKDFLNSGLQKANGKLRMVTEMDHHQGALHLTYGSWLQICGSGFMLFTSWNLMFLLPFGRHLWFWRQNQAISLVFCNLCVYSRALLIVTLTKWVKIATRVTVIAI